MLLLTDCPRRCQLGCRGHAFGTTLKTDDVRVALTTANAVTSSYTAAEASLVCSYYDAAGTLSKVTCTAANFTACAEPGVRLTYVQLC
jgi:hypothetical protein